MAFLKADLDRKTAEATIPKGSKILSNVDQFNITQDVKNTLGAMKDAYGKRTLNVTVNNQTTSSTVGSEIQKIDELLKSNDPNKLQQVIEKATTLTNKGFVEGTDAEFLKAIVNKATGLKRSYDKYLSLGTTTSKEEGTTFSENPNIMVNNGSQTLPASQYFNLPLSVLLDDSDQTVIYEYKEPSI